MHLEKWALTRLKIKFPTNYSLTNPPPTHTHIYIYIVIHRQTVSFYQNSSVCLDTLDARSQDRNPSNFTLESVSDYSANWRTTLAKGIFKVLCSKSSIRLFTFLYPIGYQSAQFFRRALHYASGVRKFLRPSAKQDLALNNPHLTI